ncbi:BnaCnng50950D [Brassica napus]|uniref:BnaCnng50950D protein n=3 Tax=Brassica TaxID=3705 RepID=A0A078JFR7_BRANA|nr:BnaCnng50950D [Brassica napus]
MHHGLIATATMLLTPNVQWDEAATISRPTKVSPWEIDPLIPSSNILNSDFQKEKRQREINEFGDVTSEQNYNDQMVQSAKENLTTNASGSFRLFGVDLTASTKARDVLEPLDSYQKGKISESFEEEKLDQIQEVTSLTEIQRKEISFSTSSTKIEMTILSSQTLDMFIDQVHMEGIGRTVDLTIFDGYNIADADH